MPDGLALENNDWFGPEDIAGLTTAFEAALAKLGLVDRSDPTTLTLAKLIIELAKAGKGSVFTVRLPVGTDTH